MSRVLFSRPFTAAFHRTPCVLLNNHRITRARFPCSALRTTQSLPVRPFSSLSFDPLTLTSAVGSPPSSSLLNSKWSLDLRHIYLLNLIACSAAVSTAWLFFSAIPSLLDRLSRRQQSHLRSCSMSPRRSYQMPWLQ
ncbi:hypothetical protein IHE45_19G031200 [Dioscorea alata]|uniref:Uncharacterized protein n=2 Tax=Dioscorea alata TaxID=55571 RepID=A0ACB7TXJ8_DIOAL|nr:hypothetical protein IHE45_19G031200 [Dioscorea alata]KAH7652655.1 hypothetical protein IHE45_19G031200 [Dioscorea alata]